MKKGIYIAIILFITAGCGTPLQQPWNNFNAYFNTFYNTQQYYEEGLELNQAQTAELNPLVPVRVFLPPTSAGLQEFELAIETGASILRNHNESKYVEPAIFIIGKSYFYRSEYFSALEKFQELRVYADSDLAQEAVFWQGRTYLEMQNINEGIRYLEQELDLVETWNESTRAKIHTLLAQLYVEQQNWSTAADLLDESLLYLEERDEQARAFFLYGQVLEEMGNYEDARLAYAEVNPTHLYYDLEFNAKRKEAELLRRLGDFDRALTLYQRMERDDKNLDVRPELSYEVARTYQFRGDINRAYELYLEIPDNQLRPPNSETLAKVYYALGEIYRFEYEDYRSAAEYFDRAAAQNVNPEQMPPGFDAAELASSFGDYAQIRQSIAEKDSLLWLGSLEGEEFNPVIDEIEAQQRAELERELREREQRGDRAAVMDLDEDSVVDAAETTEYGFLNINDPIMLADASRQFQARWGERPLVDNWRRAEAASRARLPRVVSDGEEMTLEQPDEIAPQQAQMALNLGNIPRTEEERLEVEKQRENQYYQLANIYFLSFDLPDSAAVYYQKVADSGLDSDLSPRALHSLVEIELLHGNREHALDYGEKLLELYYHTVFAQRAADRLGLDYVELRDMEPVYREAEEERNLAERARYLEERAMETTDDAQRPYLLFEAAEEYIRAAQDRDENSAEKRARWFDLVEKWEVDQENFSTLQDSAAVMLRDTTLSADDHHYWQSLADSTQSKPNLEEVFPFEGAYWDSTRSVLHQIETEHASSSVMPRVEILQKTLAKPESMQSGRDDATADAEPSVDLNGEEGEAPLCSELPEPPVISGGMDAFLQSVPYPAWAEDAGISGELSYLVTISPNGELLDFEQASSMDRSGIPQAFEQAMQAGLAFEPLSSDESVTCVITFPFDTGN